MSKHSKTMPKGEARPLGTKAPKRVKSSKPLSKDAALLQTDSINAALLGMPELLSQSEAEVKPFDHDTFLQQLQDSACNSSNDAVVSSQMNDVAILPPSSDDTISRSRHMTFIFKSTSKNGKNAMYSGAANVLRIPVNAFVGGTAPASFSVSDGVFADPKVKLTAEERKAANKLKPKPTIAEKIAAQEKKLAALRAKAV